MPRYRHLVTLAGAMLLLGGVFALAIAVMVRGPAWTHARGIIGGVLSMYLGATLIQAGNSGRFPWWIRKIFGDPGDLD